MHPCIFEQIITYFDTKISNLVANVTIDPLVYNGNTKIDCNEVNFMTCDNVLKAVQSLKLKNCEGQDRIPQLISNRMTILNNKINLDWLNLSLTSFKLKIKSQFLMN